MRKLLVVMFLLWAGSAIAADNAVTLTTGVGVTMRTTDVGAGVQSSNVILSSTSGTAIYGTAGTANANVLTIQGIASGTNLPVSVSNANPNGSAVSASSSPVVIASDQVAVAIKAASGVFASGSFASGALASGSVASGAISSGAFVSGSVGSGAIASGAVASGAFASGSIGSGAIASGALASGSIASGAFATGSFLNATASDACMFQSKTNFPIATNTTTLTQIIAASGSTKVHICSLAIISASANTVALVYGTGSNCATGGTALIGSTTVANSMSFSANGGLTFGNGGGSVAVTPASQAVCITLGTAAFVSGNLTYVQQ